VIFLNTVYVVFFTIFYLILLKIFGSKVNLNEVYYKNEKTYDLTYFVIVLVLIFFIDFFLSVFAYDYISVYFSNVLNIAFLIVLALSLNKIKSPIWILITSIIIAFYLMFIHFPIIVGGDEYIVNKGGVIKLVIFSLIFIDIIRSKKIFTTKLFFISIVSLPVFLGLANFVELWMDGVSVNFKDLVIYVSSGFELRMMENQAFILDRLDRGVLTEQSGSTYLNAVTEVFLPLQNSHLSPTQWLSNYISEGASGYNFSFIAEGIFNFGRKGVIFAAFLAACILYFVRLLLRIRWIITPFVFASMFTLPYYVFRSDLQYILKIIQFNLYCFVIIGALHFVVRQFLITISKRNIDRVD